jgi:D-glycero-D-manno-heptose 1,7-bisphosphate phosphatase
VTTVHPASRLDAGTDAAVAIRAKGPRPAVFLDRDGTLIEEVGHLGDPDGVVLIPGVPEALGRLSAAGFALVVASNQGGVARGLFTEDDIRAVNARTAALLSAAGAPAIDGWYWCPHHPESSGPCDCRKPAPGMLKRAAEELDLDLGASWMVGDHPVDAGAARAAGARAIVVRTGHGLLPGAGHDPGPGVIRADDLAAAADVILAS